jgi:hypothetical protein
MFISSTGYCSPMCHRLRRQAYDFGTDNKSRAEAAGYISFLPAPQRRNVPVLSLSPPPHCLHQATLCIAAYLSTAKDPVYTDNQERYVSKDLEGGGRDLLKGTVVAFAWTQLSVGALHPVTLPSCKGEGALSLTTHNAMKT